LLKINVLSEISISLSLLVSNHLIDKSYAASSFSLSLPLKVAKKADLQLLAGAETLGKKAAEGSPCLVRVTYDDFDELVPIARARVHSNHELLYAQVVYVYPARAAS
jgi:hypothetical protein